MLFKEKISSHEFVWILEEKEVKLFLFQVCQCEAVCVDFTHMEFSHMLNKAKNWDLNQAFASKILF